MRDSIVEYQDGRGGSPSAHCAPHRAGGTLYGTTIIRGAKPGPDAQDHTQRPLRAQGLPHRFLASAVRQWRAENQGVQRQPDPMEP